MIPTYTVQKRLRRDEMRWSILKGETEVAHVGTYLQAFRIARGLNDNADLTPERVARVDAATRGESVRASHLRDVLTARRFG